MALPTSLRHVHILEREFDIAVGRPNATHMLPHLESFTYTSLSSRKKVPADNAPDADALAQVQQAVKSFINAPQCTFKCLHSTKSPEDALADALAALKLHL
ncbi:hypothetical protein JCM8115_002188 [Rhodotorula mucilaginosa]